jgi:SnoaL-like domain
MVVPLGLLDGIFGLGQGAHMTGSCEGRDYRLRLRRLGCDREETMSDFQAVADHVEIEALRGEFTDAVMMRDYGRVAPLFTPDGALRMPNLPAELVGREQIRAGGERVPALVDFLVQTTHPGAIRLDGDRYQRTGEGWKFTERVYEVRYLDTTPPTEGPKGNQ